jgi:hypothetical protein
MFARDDKRVALPPKRDVRGPTHPGRSMSVARMVVTRCFGVSAFRFLRGEIVRIRFRLRSVVPGRLQLSLTHVRVPE